MVFRLPDSLDVKVAEQSSYRSMKGVGRQIIVLNVGRSWIRDYQAVVQEIEEQVDRTRGAVLKVILETGSA